MLQRQKIKIQLVEAQISETHIARILEGIPGELPQHVDHSGKTFTDTSLGHWWR